ncbi:very-long-chain (3R)-3-hydroxyacyl-CoA dehydratase 2 isoform 5-T6 [Amazona ochrocephala]
MAASGSGGSRADNGYSSLPPRRRKGPGALATAYLVIYNVVMTAGWLVIAVGLVRAYLAKGSYHSLYYSIEKPLKFFQTGALLEILHCAFGIVPSSVVLTAFQVMSRVFLTWAVTHSVKELSLSYLCAAMPGCSLLLLSWKIFPLSFIHFSCIQAQRIDDLLHVTVHLTLTCKPHFILYLLKSVFSLSSAVFSYATSEAKGTLSH